MHACLATVLALSLAVPALTAAQDRLGYEREIDATSLNQVPKFLNHVLNEDHFAVQTRAKLITKPNPNDLVAAEDVLLDSNVLQIVPLSKRGGDTIVRRRRGYNLENVRVPARYPYLAVPSYYRFRRWG